MRRAAPIVLGIAIAVGAALAHARWSTPPLTPRSAVAEIERHLVGKLGKAKVGSAALVLIHRGEIAAVHGFGQPSADRAASVSKAVTAWGVASRRSRRSRSPTT